MDFDSVSILVLVMCSLIAELFCFNELLDGMKMVHLLFASFDFGDILHSQFCSSFLLDDMDTSFFFLRSCIVLDSF